MTLEPEQILDGAIGKSSKELADIRPSLPINFRFKAEGLSFFGRVKQNEKGIFLRIVAEVNKLPFISENPVKREQLRSLTNPRVDLEFGHFQVDRQQNLLYWAQLPVEGPTTGADIVALTTVILLKARPYIAMARNPDILFSRMQSIAEEPKNRRKTYRELLAEEEQRKKA